MATYDDRQWILSHIQNSYVTSDDTGEGRRFPLELRGQGDGKGKGTGTRARGVFLWFLGPPRGFLSSL